MRARHELHKLQAGGRLYNIGGSKSQDTSSQTYNYDQRQVNTFDTSNYDLSNRSTNTTNADFSNRSTTNTTTNADFSDRSNTSVWSDSSNRSVTNTTSNVYNTTTDGGAVAGALGVASTAVRSVQDQLGSVLGFATGVVNGQNASTAHAYDYADNIFHGALDAVQSSDTRALDAFTRASTIERDALAMSKDGFSSALGMVQNAYADAKGTTQAQQKIMMGVLLVAAVAVLAPRLGK